MQAGNVAWSRRDLLKVGALASGGLLVTANMPTPMPSSQPAASKLNAMIRISADGTITLTLPCAEMGQGAETALPMLICEELEVDPRSVEIEFAPIAPEYVSPRLGLQGTVGSGTIRAWFDPLRVSGATAREMLRAAAAIRWQIPVEQCTAAEGRIHGIGERSVAYGEIASFAATLPVPRNLALKPQSEWRAVAKRIAPRRIEDRITGKLKFGIDQQLPGMLVAAIRQCPTLGGTLLMVDHAPALAVTDVVQVVELRNAVAVVGKGYWAAQKGLAALQPRWSPGENARLSTEAIAATLERALAERGEVMEERGEVNQALASASLAVDLRYSAPMLAHAALEPMNATAHVTQDHCEIWAPHQLQSVAQRAAAHALGFRLDQVALHTTYLGGSFGRRNYPDFIEQTVLIAKAAGKPVKLIWSREEDFGHDYYRPPSAARCRAGLDAKGRIIAIDVKVAAPSVMAWLLPERIANAPDNGAVEGLRGWPYAPEHSRITSVRKELGIPVGVWRSVGNGIHAFYLETLVDELAHQACVDPLEFRRLQLISKPRHLAVLDRLIEMARLNVPPPADRHRGFSLHECFDTIAAHCVEISLECGRPRVHRIDCAVDCGVVVNPIGALAQAEGGILFGLSAALAEKITIADGQVQQRNFNAYDVLRIDKAPQVNITFAPSDAPPGGMGEATVAGVGPALGNAIFAATNQRLRAMPFEQSGRRL